MSVALLSLSLSLSDLSVSKCLGRKMHIMINIKVNDAPGALESFVNDRASSGVYLLNVAWWAVEYLLAEYLLASESVRCGKLTINGWTLGCNGLFLLIRISYEYDRIRIQCGSLQKTL